MASANYTYFFTAGAPATDHSVPREWTQPRPSASQPVAIAWEPPAR